MPEKYVPDIGSNSNMCFIAFVGIIFSETNIPLPGAKLVSCFIPTGNLSIPISGPFMITLLSRLGVDTVVVFVL